MIHIFPFFRFSYRTFTWSLAIVHFFVLRRFTRLFVPFFQADNVNDSRSFSFPILSASAFPHSRCQIDNQACSSISSTVEWQKKSAHFSYYNIMVKLVAVKCDVSLAQFASASNITNAYILWRQRISHSIHDVLTCRFNDFNYFMHIPFGEIRWRHSFSASLSLTLMLIAWFSAAVTYRVSYSKYSVGVEQVS